MAKAASKYISFDTAGNFVSELADGPAAPEATEDGSLKSAVSYALDAIVEAVAKAFAAQASALAEMAVQETGFGNAEDKTAKNLFASQRVAEAVRDMRTVGVLREVPEKKLWEIGVPVGVIAAIIPSTNPTSTVCYKALIAIKAGCAIVFSPHPKAAKCTRAAAELLHWLALSAQRLATWLVR